MFGDRPELTKVNPLVTGLVGIDPFRGGSVNLIPFVAGWMDWPNAIIARDAGDVEILVHESTSSRTYYDAPTTPTIPVVQSAYIESANPNRLFVVFNDPVALSNGDSFALSGTYAGAIVSVNQNQSPEVIDIVLDTPVVGGDTITVDHTAIGGSDLRNGLDGTLKVIDFAQVVTNNIAAPTIVITTAAGTDLAAAILTFAGDFSVGTTMSGDSTSDVDGLEDYAYTSVANQTTTTMILAFVDYANTLTATSGVLWTAKTTTAEALAVDGNVTVDLANFAIV